MNSTCTVIIIIIVQFQVEAGAVVINEIMWDEGEYIEGTHKGTFTYSINQANIVGRITGTSDGWSHLMDCKIHTLSPVDLVVGYAECYFIIN